MNGLEELKRLATSDSTTEEDNYIMQAILHKIDFPKAIVTSGIVYLEGRGTIDAPPAPICSVAKKILEAINNL